eukprot:Ihof_evm8s62 gene=Ihof_evmTU8s62
MHLKKGGVDGNKKNRKEGNHKPNPNKVDTPVADQDSNCSTSVLSTSINTPSSVKLESQTSLNPEIHSMKAVDTSEEREEKGPKKSKAQRRREKKELESASFRAAVLEESRGNISFKVVEDTAFSQILKSQGLAIHEIPADGHCLYAAICHQLKYRNSESANKEEEVTSLRHMAANHIRRHIDDYLPYMVNDDGDMLTSDEFESYCIKLESTSDWGGQLELRALSEALQRRIIVMQSNTAPLTFGPTSQSQPLRL